MTAPVADPIDYSQSLLEQCEAILAATDAQKRDEQRILSQSTLIRLWDGDWKLQHVVSNPYEEEWEWVDNDSGTGSLTVAAESPEGQWALDMQGRIARGEKRNIHVTVDYSGARWGGRLEDVTAECTDDGELLVTMTFLHDYENLKRYLVWSNPFLPAAVQIPRIWMMPGPARWALLVTLFCQIFREQSSIWQLPDDPLKLSSWFKGLDMSQWSVVVKPLSFIDDMAAGTLWAMPNSRFKYWHEMAQATLQDAELSVRCDRWLEGDPEPWEGANLRHGALMVSIEDHSGRFIGTSNGGTVADGLLLTAETFIEGFIDTTANLIADTDTPQDYFKPGKRLTDKRLPYAVVRPGVSPGVASAKFTDTPASATQVVVGGHSMPGVNEVISASIQGVGDVVGTLLHIGAIGGPIDTLLKPVYEDTLLAWMAWKSVERAQHSGWSRYFEHFQDGADKAYTLSAMMVLRAGFWATRTWKSHELEILADCPWIVGDNGFGHIWLSSRFGSTIPGSPDGQIVVDRISKLVLKGGDGPRPEWSVTIGDDRKNVDPLVQVMGRIENLLSAVQTLGVL